MPIWQAVLLGVIQGVTEFLPISSTAHLLVARSLLGHANPEEFVEGIPAGPKGFRRDTGGGEAEHAWAEKAIESMLFIDVIAIELAALTSKEATCQGDMAGTGQGVDGVRTFVFAKVSTWTGTQRPPFFSALSMNSCEAAWMESRMSVRASSKGAFSQASRTCPEGAWKVARRTS